MAKYKQKKKPIPPVPKLGSKHALGNDGGRPRTVCPPDDELISLGKEMLKWVKEIEPIHLSQWYAYEKLFPDSVWDVIKQHPMFLPYYEICMKLVGIRYIDGRCDKVKDNVTGRWQRVYFKSEIKKDEDDSISFKVREEIKAKQELLNEDKKAPNQDDIDKDHENLQLKHQNKQLAEKIRIYEETMGIRASE